MKQIIHDVAGAHISSVSHAIQQSIADTMQDLEIMLEKTALPRPAAMGMTLSLSAATPQNNILKSLHNFTVCNKKT